METTLPLTHCFVFIKCPCRVREQIKQVNYERMYIYIHDKQAKAKVYTQDSFFENCPGFQFSMRFEPMTLRVLATRAAQLAEVRIQVYKAKQLT